MAGTLFAATILVIKKGTGIELLNKHEKAGWSVVFIVLFFAITGFASFIAKRVFKWNSKAIRTFRWVHRLVAYAMFGLVTYTLYLGLKHHIQTINGMDQYGFWINLNLGGMIGIVCIFEIIYRIVKSGHTDFATPTLQEVIDEKTFEKRIADGQKLVILDDMVLDVSNFSY